MSDETFLARTLDVLKVASQPMSGRDIASAAEIYDTQNFLTFLAEEAKKEDGAVSREKLAGSSTFMYRMKKGPTVRTHRISDVEPAEPAFKIREKPLAAPANVLAPVAEAHAKVRRSMNGLRGGILDVMEKLANGQISAPEAKAYAMLSMTVIKSVEVQVEYERLRLEQKVGALPDLSLVSD